MKNFLFAVFVWFLFQVVFLSALGNMKNAELVGAGITPEQKVALQAVECSDSGSGVGFMMGALFPVTYTPLIEGDWCWNQ